MTENEVFLNVDVHANEYGWNVGHRHFPSRDWSMEVIFTRKVKPAAVGTIAICLRPSSPLRLAERFEYGWKTFFPAKNAADWTGTLEEQDELARRCWRPIMDAAWEDE